MKKVVLVFLFTGFFAFAEAQHRYLDGNPIWILHAGQDIFVHATGLKEEIRDGDAVTFEVAQGKRGLNAVNVQRAA